MKEIKFRFWDGEEMEIPSDLGLYRFEEMGITHVVNGKGNPHYGECFVMQYTGLKDKNGVEIYEGDIVKIKAPELSSTLNSIGNPSFEVRYRNGSFSLEIKNKKYLWIYIHDPKEIEIIGNIHENPDLIK